MGFKRISRRRVNETWGRRISCDGNRSDGDITKEEGSVDREVPRRRWRGQFRRTS